MGDIFEEYAVLQSQIEALEAKKAQLRPHILEMIIERGENVDIGVGKFILSTSKSWKFPELVTKEIEKLSEGLKEIKDEIKAVEAKAISTGEALCEETKSFRFTPVKL